VRCGYGCRLTWRPSPHNPRADDRPRSTTRTPTAAMAADVGTAAVVTRVLLTASYTVLGYLLKRAGMLQYTDGVVMMRFVVGPPSPRPYPSLATEDRAATATSEQPSPTSRACQAFLVA